MDDQKSYWVVMGIAILQLVVTLAVLGAAIWVAAHFISKYW